MNNKDSGSNNKENTEILSVLNLARDSFGLDELNSNEELNFADLFNSFNELKNQTIEALHECEIYPNRDEIIRILEKDYIPPLDIIKLKNNNYKFAKILQDEIDDVNSKELIEKPDENIYMYLYKRGWILSKRMNPEKIFLYIYVNSQWGDELLRADNLNKLIPMFFIENNISVIDIINSWNHNYFVKRKHIFNECIETINHKLYYCSISTLLTQLEGILYDAYGKKVTESDARGFWNVKKSFSYLFGDKEENDSWYKALHYILENDIYANFGESFLDNIDNNNIKSNTNRNEILHGLNVNYGDYCSLLKVVMLLDAIHDILIIDDVEN